MADILINEISQNYSYVIGDNSYCCVALPITASWGPAYLGSEKVMNDTTGKINVSSASADEQAIEDIVWTRFKANSQGLESFVSTYRGAAANYRLAQDYSYQMAVSLLTAGYDVLVCRVSPGIAAAGNMSNSIKRDVVEDTQDAKKVSINDAVSVATFALNREPNDENSFICTSTNPNFNSNYREIKLDKNGKQTEESKKWLEYSKTGETIVVKFKRPFIVLDVAPADWNTNWKSYYSKSGDTYTPLSDNSAPTFAENTYYRTDYPTWESVGIMADDSITITYSTDICAVDPITGKAGQTGSLTLTAKYPGTFGNNIRCSLNKMESRGQKYWNLITYIQDASGVRLAVENMIFTFDITNSTDNIPYVEEVQSQFVDIVAEGLSEDTVFAAANGQTDVDNANTWIEFSGGTDKSTESDITKCLKSAIAYVGSRYGENPRPSRVYTYTVDVTLSGTTDSVDIKAKKHYNGKEVVSDKSAPIQSEETGAPTLVKGTDYTVNKSVITLTPTGKAKFDEGEEYVYTVDCEYAGWYAQTSYLQEFCNLLNQIDETSQTPEYPIDSTTAQTLLYREWLFTNCLPVYELLTDKLAYNPNRLISPGWDDQDFLFVTGEDKYPNNMMTPSPLQIKLMDVAYASRCATAYLDIPRSLSKVYVTNSSQQPAETGYAQRLARYNSGTDGLRSTHAALFGPWGNYIYVGTNKQNIASPSFLALLIQRSMVLNQSLQYEWIQPTSRKNNVKIGKMDYTVSKKYLDKWQPDPDTEGGVGVNAIANIPDLGLSVWGDSTLYENPPATYQALRNLSTRLLVNAIKNVVYRVGISITFQYTNQTAFSSFYVGVTPILDSMKNAGAIGDYKVVIGNDFDALGMVKANSCVGKIYITPNGTIQRITIDLIALPPQTDLTNYT